MSLPKEIIDLSESFSSLPGIGPKLSNKLALYLAVKGKRQSQLLKNALNASLENIRECVICGNVTNEEKCEICAATNRDESTLIIVEDPLDLYTIEGTGEYKGLYHVLHGVISPINGIGAMDINLSTLFDRLSKGNFNEVIIALNPNVEGDSTSMYIVNEINKINSNIIVSRLAKGIPVGSDLEYVSPQTIIDSMKSRTKID